VPADAHADGWRPLTPGRSAGAGAAAAGAFAPSPFSRLAVAHAFSVAGDTLLTIALAGSLFFSISPGAAKGKVALYLALTVAPFAVVAPLIGPLLDRSRGARRLVMAGTNGGRAIACFLMAGDLDGLLLFPEAFAFLVLSKGYSITKSALVPAVVVDDDELVEANSKLQLVGVAVGFVAALPGALLLQTVGAEWTLRLAAVVFACGTVAAFRLAAAPAVAPPETAEARNELRAAGIVLAASAMGLLRAIVGFLTFEVAFSFRRGGAPSWWFGVVLAVSMAATFVGAVTAPRLRESVREERMLVASLALVAVVALVAARGNSVRFWSAVVAGAVGLAASTGKLAFDSIVQRDAPDAARGRSFARFETRFQLLWVAGAFLPVVIPIPGRVGFVVVAGTAAFAAVTYVLGRRATQH
jgi:hypothetical protein